MQNIHRLALLSALAALGLSACAPSENYDANGNYRGASDHSGGGYQRPVSDDDHYYHSGADNSNRHHKHNTIAVPSDNPNYDHNRDRYYPDDRYAPANGW